MALNWNSVTAEHVRQACEVVAGARAGKHARGIVIWYQDLPLPAKQVQRIAYRIANHLPENSEVKFSSGDATLALLGRLGFRAERIGARAREGRTNAA